MVEENIEYGIATATSCVVIGLYRHKRFEKWIEDIQAGKNGFSNAIMNPTHKGPKLTPSAFGAV